MQSIQSATYSCVSKHLVIRRSVRTNPTNISSCSPAMMTTTDQPSPRHNLNRTECRVKFTYSSICHTRLVHRDHVIGTQRVTNAKTHKWVLWSWSAVCRDRDRVRAGYWSLEFGSKTDQINNNRGSATFYLILSDSLNLELDKERHSWRNKDFMDQVMNDDQEGVINWRRICLLGNDLCLWI